MSNNLNGWARWETSLLKQKYKNKGKVSCTRYITLKNLSYDFDGIRRIIQLQIHNLKGHNDKFKSFLLWFNNGSLREHLA